MLAGVDFIKFAFFTRKSAKDNTHHVLLGTYGVDTRNFANQINLNMPVCWAILRETVDRVYYQNEVSGEYIFMKDPGKALMRLFKVTTEDEDEDEVEEEL